ncbi:MOXD1 1 [Chionoecetes opilio]|uniref:MOXD1 1 n=1 Tax=Chionoecetes opilio TaxID=41210 RepID=A0A8J4YFG7_CHIOP|nr:MOXD1 1 [Chionoecetes opilio]
MSYLQGRVENNDSLASWASCTKKRELVWKFVPVVQPGNEEHVHHILFFECYVPNSDTHFEQWLEGRGTQCYSANMPVSWHYCKSMVIGWAIGGKGEMFPLNAGFPVGEEHGGATYFMMETHYDNPNMRRGVVDSSGLRIFYTEKLREHDAGLLMVGHGVVPQHIVPPKQQRFISAGFCDSSCTKQSLPVGGVSVFQGVLHSHLLGASLVLRHIRNGQELPVILQDMKYDFNYQSTRVLKEEIRLLPGDTLLTECYYDSSNRTMPTFGGFGTKEEMCLAFIGYYPRVNLFSCTSKPQLKDILAPLGIEKVIMDQKSKGNPNAGPSGTRKASSQKMKPIVISNFLRNIRITAPQKYLNMSLYDVLHDERTWRDPTVTDSFQQMTTSGVHEAKCYTRSDKPSKVEKLVPYPSFRTLRQKPDQCALAKCGHPFQQETQHILLAESPFLARNPTYTSSRVTFLARNPTYTSSRVILPSKKPNIYF